MQGRNRRTMKTEENRKTTKEQKNNEQSRKTTKEQKSNEENQKDNEDTKYLRKLIKQNIAEDGQVDSQRAEEQYREMRQTTKRTKRK